MSLAITAASVEWHESYSNAPSLVIEIDAHLPKLADYRFEQRGAHFFAQHESGLCSFLYWDGPSDHGYGGSVFDITMTDGTPRSLKGPWSGNESSMAAAGFPRTYGCRVRHRVEWGDGWSEHGHVHLLEPLWLDAIARFCPDAHAVLVTKGAGAPDMAGEQNAVIGHGLKPRGPVVQSYEIARRGMTFEQSQAFKRARVLKQWTAQIHDSDHSWEKPLETRTRMALAANELIIAHGLAAFGVEPFDLNHLPPLLPPRPPEPPRDWACDENGEPLEDYQP